MTSTLKFIMDNKYCVSWASAVVGREMYGHVLRAGLCGLGALCLREVSPSRGNYSFFPYQRHQSHLLLWWTAESSRICLSLSILSCIYFLPFWGGFGHWSSSLSRETQASLKPAHPGGHRDTHKLAKRYNFSSKSWVCPGGSSRWDIPGVPSPSLSFTFLHLVPCQQSV